MSPAMVIEIALSYTGKTLDRVGELHGCVRNPAETDEGYRSRLRPIMVAAFAAVVPLPKPGPAATCLRVALAEASRLK